MTPQQYAFQVCARCGKTIEKPFAGRFFCSRGCLQTWKIQARNMARYYKNLEDRTGRLYGFGELLLYGIHGKAAAGALPGGTGPGLNGQKKKKV